MTALRKEYPGVPVATLCGLFGKRRQWYYESKKSVLPERSRREALRFVMDGHRLSCPRMGCTKLCHLVRRTFPYMQCVRFPPTISTATPITR